MKRDARERRKRLGRERKDFSIVAAPAEPAAPPVMAPFYRPELDAIRFAAFFAVFLHHTVANVMAGAFGVDLFLTLSAYLITELLQREVKITGTIHVGRFYARRILRIWPLYFAFLALAYFVWPRFLRDDWLPANFLLAFLVLGGNWITANRGYPPSSAAPLWSISLEEQFYIVWPLLFRFFRRRLAWVGLTMMAVSIAARVIIWRAQIPHPFAWCSTVSRLDSLAAGILLAAWLRGRRPKLSRWIALLILPAAWYSWHLVAVYWPPDRLAIATALITYSVVAFSSAALIYAVMALNVPIPRPITYLGKISYGLYVFHVFAGHVANQFVPRAGLWMPYLTMAITIAAAALSYELFEKPFLRLKTRLAVVPSRPV